MKLYHYIVKGSNVMRQGLLSFAKNPNADIAYYTKRTNATTHKGVCEWMEKCFKGRSRGIRCFTTPLQWTQKSLRIKELIDACDLLEIDISALAKDGFIEAVYVKPSIFDEQYHTKEELSKLHSYGADECLFLLNKGIDDIDYDYKQTWNACDDSKGLRMGPLRYYVLIIKGGIIPPKYIRKITD